MTEPLQTSSSKQSNLSLSTVVVQSPDLLDCEMDEDLVLMSIENEAYYGMDSIGKRIWWAMANPVSVQSLCEQLQQQFEIDPLACENEVIGYLNELLVEGLIHEV